MNKKVGVQWFSILMTIVLMSCGSTKQSDDKQSDDIQSDEKNNKPNVVVIFTDDMNYKDISALGGEVLTPTLDRLMTQGVEFTNFYDCSAVCSPSRYNLLTGRYASRSKSLVKQFPKTDPAFLRWNVDIEKGDRTIASVLKEQGYYTGFVGKYHNLQNEDIQEHVDKNADIHDKKVQATIARNYKKLKDSIQVCTEFDYVENVYANNLHALELPIPMQYHNMDWITAGGLDFIERAADKDKPFFLYFATTLPHVPAPLSSMHADARITPSGLLKDAPNVLPSRQDVFDKVENAGLPLEKAPYTWLDDAVGALVQKLDKKGLLENTIILFASDHGGNKAKMTCYEKGVRAPAFAYWKGHLEGGKKVDNITANIDFAPTIYDLCGIDYLENEQIDGKSLMPLLRGEATDWRKSLLLEITYSKAVVTKDYKYIAVRFPEATQKKVESDKENLYNHEGTLFSKDNPNGKIKVRYNADKLYPAYFDYDQLYDLKKDVDEQVNLALDSAYQSQVNSMKELLSYHIKGFYHAFGEFTSEDH